MWQTAYCQAQSDKIDLMPKSTLRRALKTLLPGSLVLLVSTATVQIAGAGQAEPGSLPTQLHYQSVFSAYQADVDPPVQSWREANERVGKIGGWRAYAKEAASAEPAKDTPAADPHAGHHGGAKP